MFFTTKKVFTVVIYPTPSLHLVRQYNILHIVTLFTSQSQSHNSDILICSISKISSRRRNDFYFKPFTVVIRLHDDGQAIVLNQQTKIIVIFSKRSSQIHWSYDQ